MGWACSKLVQAGALQQHFETDNLECAFMGGFKSDRCDHTSFEGSFPRFDANAPAVASFESGEAVFGAGRDQVVADGCLVVEEFVGHEDTNGVLADVVGAAIALAVAVETGERVDAAGLQDAA